MYKVILYETQSGRNPVQEYMAELARQNRQDELSRILTYNARLEEHGMAVNQLYPKTIRKLRGDIYELRPGKHRVFFFFFTGKHFVLLHAYRKFKDKAPPKEIDKAEEEMKDYIRRHRT